MFHSCAIYKKAIESKSFQEFLEFFHVQSLILLNHFFGSETLVSMLFPCTVVVCDIRRVGNKKCSIFKCAPLLKPRFSFNPLTPTLLNSVCSILPESMDRRVSDNKNICILSWIPALPILTCFFLFLPQFMIALPW